MTPWVADRDGATWACSAGYDPCELARLCDRMHERTQRPKIPFASQFRTHPYHEDRSAAILRRFDASQQKDPRSDLYIGTKKLELRIPKSVQRFAE